MKEVIQAHLPVGLPCYDLLVITHSTVDARLHILVGFTSSSILYFHQLTGGVYKARERIHRVMLLRDY